MLFCEQFPKMEGRQMVMVLAPLKKTKSKSGEKKKASESKKEEQDAVE